MTGHILDDNTAESAYFGKLSRNGKAAYRHVVYTLTGDLPIWAKGLRNVYTKIEAKVYTQEVVTNKVYTGEVATAESETKTGTVLSYDEERLQPGWIDPLTLL
jgi:hypothetical protein